jgi:acyl transferase domain-containing protein/NADPH:quinone reductase-like Zn-dependent oxidoreductase/NAD(P)-dependent dehydrogenase (short-subunit alcohol dehydrogenase family)
MTDKPIPCNSSDHAALLKQALRAGEQMRRRLEWAERRRRQPIAIIGMGCRFPGAVHDPESFWQLLKHGREAISEVPADRWDIDAYYDPDPSRPGKMVSRFGGFLKDIDRFDAAFFGIAPREAAMMDPQQRLLLEVAWEALERAGVAPRSLAGSRTGMYLGMASGDYAQLQLHAGDASLLDVHYASGNAHSIASGRLSYLLGLKGPSLTIDTACSSSLVAVHLACQALRSGECTMAIAGGVNLILAPETTVALSHAHMMSPDGRSKAFDDRADGFARAEGCGVVILKPLEQAQDDGDPILAVIRGTALNQDGASSSLTAPNGPSQEDLMRRALEDAGKTAAEVGYVEAHGTGTSLGDPIELRALGAVYGTAHKREEPLLVGSLKTNFGHMEAAAGVGGLIRLVLALENGEIPAHLQFVTPTSHVPWDQLRLAVSMATIPWPASSDADGKPLPRLGAVSSFGFSGTNAHLVVEQAPANATPLLKENAGHDEAAVLSLSAASIEALRELAERYEHWLGDAQTRQYAWPEIVSTAATGRDPLRYRAAFVAGSRNEAAVSLRQFLSVPGPEKAHVPPSLCLLFTGQGSEHSGMGLELLEKSSVFRNAVARLESALDGILPSGIAAIWANRNGELESASLVQPALYALGWALSELWRSWGVEPNVVLGHSLGEYIAATVAGVMTPEEGIRLVAARGRLTQELGAPGGMIAIVASEDEVRSLLASSFPANEISIAAVNGPASVVVSGRRVPLQSLEEYLRQSGLRHKRLRTTHGFHSAALDGMLDAFEAEAAKISFRPPEIRWISNVTGRAVERRSSVDANYWQQHLRHTVEFQRGLASVEASGASVFLELGAEPQLLALAEANGIADDRRIASIRKSGDDGEWRKLLSAAAQLYTQGVNLNWKGLFEGRAMRRVPLPTYPFQRRRFWFTDHRIPKSAGATPPAPASAADRFAGGHPLTGSRLRMRSETVTFHAELTPSSPAHLGDHVVLGRRILPGAAYLEMALAAAQQIAAGMLWQAADVEFREPCVFDEPRLLETVVSAADSATGRRHFEIASSPLMNPEREKSSTEKSSSDDWTLHATGFLEPARVAFDGTLSEAPAAIQSRAKSTWEKDAFYARFLAMGLNFGSAFMPVERAWGGDEESLVAFALEPAVIAQAGRYGIHPIALDACLQAAAALASSGASAAPALPAALRSFQLAGDPSALRYAHAKVSRRQGRALTVDIRGLDALGKSLLAIEGLTLVEAPQEQYRGWLHQVEWEQVELSGDAGKQADADAKPLSPISLDSDLLQQELAVLAQRNRLEEFDQWMAEFDELCAAWIAESFVQGGFVLLPGREFSFAALLETLTVIPQHHRLARRFVEILGESGYVEQTGQDRFRVRTKASPDTASLAARLRLANHPEMAWTERTVGQLLPLLRGEVTPVDALFSESGRQIATRLYRDSLVARTLNPALVAAAVQAAAQRHGSARVLEAGGGTAATTSYMIPALIGQMEQYVWTDIGAGFVSAARREFGSVAGMQFQTLDLERDPVEQGLGAGSFDIVIASNVIHATADLKATLRHIHSLMTSGGVLLMAETLGKQPWIDLTVGFTEGWWRYTDLDLRPDYTLIDKKAWRAILEDAGFGNVLLIPDCEHGVLSQQCVIAAVSSPEENQYNDKNSRQIANAQLLIVTSGDIDKRQSFAESLAEMARNSGASVTLISATDATQATLDAWFAASANLPGNKRHVIYLPGAEVAGVSAADSGREALDWQTTVLGGVLQWTQALLASERLADCRLWLVSRGAFGPEMSSPDGASLAAFARSLRAEYPEAHVAAVDLSFREDAAGQLWKLCQNPPALATQFALRNTGAWVPRLVPLILAAPDRSLPESETRRLRFPNSGLLEDLKPSSEARRHPAANEVEIAIHATAVNFHEILSALEAGSPHDVAPGGECAGVVVRVGDEVQDLKPGDEVVAIGTGLMADFATLSRERIWKMPTRITAEEAATLLIPFLTARWSLERVAKLQPGERVLVHAGAGGVGLAAIQEAKRLGALVYATAGSEAKREYLRGLNLEGVFDSRSTAFESGVLIATGFRGVDVVLNSLGGDKIAAGLRTLAPRGRFIELGEQTVLSNNEVKAHRPDVSYQRVHLRAALAAAAPEVRALLALVLGDVESGIIHPLPWKSFDLADAALAFRYMASGQHTGRVLLTPSAPAARFAVRHDGAYLVTGGFNGLGLLTVEWLAAQGAGCVLALGRSEPDINAQSLFLRLQNNGTVIVAVRCDVSDEDALAQAIRAVPSRFTLRGVFHAAGTLDDASLPQQTPQRFRNVLAAKVAGAWNLHQLTQSAALDCFVLFSSAAGLLGSRGQSNHAAANAWMDALAHYRREQMRQPALSVNWGAWSGTGAAVRHNAVERSERAGVASIPPADGLRILQRLLEEDCTQVFVSSVNWQKWAERSKAAAAANADLLSRVLRAPQAARVEQPQPHMPETSIQPAGQSSWKEQLLAAPKVRQFAVLESRVEDRIRSVLSLPVTQPIDGTRPLQEYGLDSLLSIELRNALASDLDAKLPATMLFDYTTLAALTNWLFRDVLKLRAKEETEAPAGTEPAKAQDVIEGVSSLSDDEVEKLFQQKMAAVRR